jgi:hypothetical protein
MRKIYGSDREFRGYAQVFLMNRIERYDEEIPFS